MHSKFKTYLKDWIAVPSFEDEGLEVNASGQVRFKGVLLKPYTDGDELCVNVNGLQLGVAKLVLSVYKPMFIKQDPTIQIGYCDHDITNCAPGNLVWIFTKPIPVKGYPDFYHIPESTRCAITRTGEIINLVNGRKPTQHVDKNGYVMVSLLTDWGKYVNTGRHRAIAMTFNGYDEQIYSMVTNHINGVPGDDRPENVEIVSYSENIDHAYRNGLRSDNKHVLVKDCVTGVETEYHSYGEAARQIGGDPSNIFYAVRQPADRLYRDRYLVVFKPTQDDFTFPPPDLKLVGGRGGLISCINREGVVFTVNSVKEAGELVGVSHARLIFYINSNCQLWYNGWRCKLTDWTPWKDISDYKFEIVPFASCFYLYRITNLETYEQGYYNNLKNVDLPGWKIKQLDERFRITDTVYQYKNYRIEVLPWLF